MKDIQMVDLVSQYSKIKEEVDIAVINVMKSSAYINGPEVKEFQKELEQYLNVKHVIPCANGTDALQVAMMALGLKPGDEVITSDFTFAATVEVVGLLGLTLKLADVEEGTYNIDLDSLKKVITPKTKAIVPVHLFGQCCNMDAVMEIAKEHNLFVIEDTAQAIGSEYTFKDGTKKKAGCIGDIGTTSFFPSKNLGCMGDGGAIFTNNDELAATIRSVVNHGMQKRYYYDKLGVNSRLDSMQAAILRIKLKQLDNYIDARQKAAAFYDNAFADIDAIETPERFSSSTHVFHQYTLKSKGINTFELQDFLKEKGIPCMIYYPVPLHEQEAYGAENFDHNDFPITNKLCKSVFSLPMHTELEDDQLTYITESVKEFFNK